MQPDKDTIVAIATGTGGALAVIRVSGPHAIGICDALFHPASGDPLAQAAGYTLHYGYIKSPDDDRVMDDVIVSLFRSPRSYTGEDMVEISCHGSQYIQQSIVGLLLSAGARNAQPGEFTLRAFLAGKLDLSQAEAVADIIASTDRATHRIASSQMRGGYSETLRQMRKELIQLSALLELELDFSEEDVEFADRTQLQGLIAALRSKTAELIDSFSLGNAIKEGIAVAIVGSPNVGKSTLLNTLLKDDRAMVSDIPGTTRDVIEEVLVINGVKFRLIDTAGIRQTDDTLEKMGISRTLSSIEKANTVLLMVTPRETQEGTYAAIEQSLSDLQIAPYQRVGVILNKIDTCDSQPPFTDVCGVRVFPISAKLGTNIGDLLDWLVGESTLAPLQQNDVIVSNARHVEALAETRQALDKITEGIVSGLPGDLLALELRQALFHLGTITGEVTTEEVLGSIFSKFCIGK